MGGAYRVGTFNMLFAVHGDPRFGAPERWERTAPATTTCSAGRSWNCRSVPESWRCAMCTWTRSIRGRGRAGEVAPFEVLAAPGRFSVVLRDFAVHEQFLAERVSDHAAVSIEIRTDVAAGT